MKRKRLQKIFAHGSKMMAQENYDYATELFAQCIVGDPSNLIYVQNYVGNLQKKYGNNKTGGKLAQFKERGARSAVKKAISQGAWDDVIKHGLKVLAVNPWDVPTLTAMAAESAYWVQDEEVELFYLKCALETNPKGAEVNRLCAHSMAARRQYDQAIACWHRVKAAKPDDEEAEREMGRLAVEKTIDRGGYDSEDKSDEMSRVPSAGKAASAEPEIPREELLKRQIQEDPEEISNYYRLAQLHIDKERYDEAEKVLADALKASGDDPDVREKWEDAQLRHLRQKITLAEDDETKKKFRAEMLEMELQRFRNRCERYPSNLSFKYDLGYRYQLLGKYKEAIKFLQEAQNDPRRRAMCLYRLGQCFQKIKQYRLAMTHYESAIKEMPEREADARKDLLYQAGKIAMAMKNIDLAEKHLTELAAMDFTYKDVSTLLDKIAELGENQGA